MKKSFIYSIYIYLILFMILCFNQEQFVDNNNNVKSYKFFCKKFNNWTCYNDLITLPLLTIIIALFSYILGNKIDK